jgi:hypothetical protein
VAIASTTRRCALAALTIALIVAFPAHANPVTEFVVFVHIQQPDPDQCENNPITSCEDIVQYTTEMGVLEFDLYIWTYLSEPPMHSLEAALVWPQSWEFLEWEVCNLGQAEFELTSTGANVSMAWEHCPPMENNLFLAARFVLDVTCEGYFTRDDWMVWSYCPPEDWSSMFWRGHAGVQCSYNYLPCDWEFVCSPSFHGLNELHLEVLQGESVQESLELGSCDCDQELLDIHDTERWMALEVEWLSSWEGIVTLTVDTSGLEVGSYEGWVVADGSGQGGFVSCVKVYLDVLPSAQGIPDEDDLPNTGDIEEMSWGKIKVLYK